MATPEYTPKDIKRFWAKVDKSLGSDKCWLWQATRTAFGHGQFYLHRRMAYAHRVAYEITSGPIPDGICVCHHCDNPSCVNPKHLFLGTKQDNTQDMLRKGRAKGGSFPGDRNPSRKVTDTQREAIRQKYHSGISPTVIGREYGIGRSQVWRIATANGVTEAERT